MTLAWQIAHGQTPDRVANHPELAEQDIPRTGQGASIATLVTKSLLLRGEAQLTTGEEVGAVKLPAPQTGSPMAY